MRINYLPILLAGASVVQYATASPIRIIVFTEHGEVSDPSRITTKVVRPGMSFMEPGVSVAAVPPQGGHRLCDMVKNKALEISNKFRETFGLPLITSTHAPMTNIIDLSSTRPPTIDLHYVEPLPLENRPVHSMAVALPSPVQEEQSVVHWGPGRGMRRGGCHRSFLHRVHRALTILGPWEDRAVAFVFGCGIGVLLRMFWVMAIVVARSFRARNNTEDGDVQHVLIFGEDAENILAPPPQYTDEKVALIAIEEDKKDATA